MQLQPSAASYTAAIISYPSSCSKQTNPIFIYFSGRDGGVANNLFIVEGK